MRKLLLFYIFIIISISYIVIFHNLEKGSLADWDEAVYAEVSKEILLTQDWITLHYKFQPWFNKPPLLFHLVSISYKLFGISTFSSRIWPALFGIGTILVTFFLAKELFNQNVAFMSSLVLATSPQFIHKARMLMLDVPVAFFIILSLYLFVLTEKRKSAYLYYLLGISLGLGIMVKGVIGLIPFFIIFAYLLLTKNMHYILSKDFLIVMLVFVVITIPWHVTQIVLHKSNFVNDYLVYHVLQRVAEPLERHNYGNLFYFRVLKYGFKLWLYPLILSVLYLIIFESKRNKEKILLFSWIAITFGIFLIAKTKLPWYLIPLYPAFAITIAYFLDNVKLKKIYIGLITCLIIFIFSFKLPQSCYGHNELSNINLIAERDLRVHNSAYDSPGELFYLGVKRYSDEELLKEDAFYVASDRAYEEKFSSFKSIYRDGGYVLFAKHDVKIKKKLSKIPETQKEPVRFCYSYMPMNLGYCDW